jgi:transposase
VGNKTDGNDADAIYEASLRPKCRPVPVKAIEQQDLMLTQLERDRLIKQRTALTNQVRAVLAERGLVFGKGLKTLREGMREVLARSPDQEVTAPCLEWLQIQLTDWQHLDERLKDCERRMNRDFRAHPRCQQLQEVDGIGLQTALFFFALVGDGSQFASGRACGSWVGLTPLESSSGERRFLGAITKRGDSTLRWLLVNGGRTLAAQAKRKAKHGLPLNARDTWLLGLIQRGGFNKAAVAMANKNARILWAMLRSGEAFRSPLMAA